MLTHLPRINAKSRKLMWVQQLFNILHYVAALFRRLFRLSRQKEGARGGNIPRETYKGVKKVESVKIVSINIKSKTCLS